jgi:hypothetical protein
VERKRGHHLRSSSRLDPHHHQNVAESSFAPDALELAVNIEIHTVTEPADDRGKPPIGRADGHKFAPIERYSRLLDRDQSLLRLVVAGTHVFCLSQWGL